MQTRYDRCPNCLQALTNGEDKCGGCGFDIASYAENPRCLRAFSVLENKYMVGRCIGKGGFGITYIGWDMNLQTYIAIKEYFPDTQADRALDESGMVVPKEGCTESYNQGLSKYVEEARMISKFYGLPGIASVKDFFYANGTAYMVMEYISGVNLKEYIASNGGRLDEQTVLNLMKPVFESLKQIHDAGLIHRDISPDNIMYDNAGKIKLIDFGSARTQSMETDKTFTVVLKHGYAPVEQYYAKGNQGPATDIYSLCATMYKMLTDVIPPNSVERSENDTLRTPGQLRANVSERTWAVIKKGLEIKAADRYQSIGELLVDLYGDGPIPVAKLAPNPVKFEPAGVASPVNQTPISAAPTASEPGEMFIELPAEKEPKKGNNGKNIAYIVITIAVLVGLGFLVYFISGGKADNSKKATNTDATKTTTEHSGSNKPDSTTEAGGKNEDYKYEWPTELSDNWRDYQFNVNGKICDLPIPYEEWINMGWSGRNIPEVLAAGDSYYEEFTMNDITVVAVLYNFALSELSTDKCFVIGISIDQDDNPLPEGAAIMVAGGLKVGEASEKDVKSIFGAPEFRYEDDEEKTVELDYAGDDLEDGASLLIDANGKLKNIHMVTGEVPKGYKISKTDMETKAPDFNNDYVAPTSGSKDRFDAIVTIDNVHYKLPAPTSEFLKNGWKLDSSTDDYISGNSIIDTYLEKDGSRIKVSLRNYTSDAMLPVNSFVEAITLENGYFDLDGQLSGGISLNSAAEDFERLYSDLGERYSDTDSTNTRFMYAYSYPIEGESDSIVVTMYIDKESGKTKLVKLEYYQTTYNN